MMTSVEFIEFYKRLYYLSDREMECLDLVSKGFLSKEIGCRLDISEKTVNNFLLRARRKLKLHNTKSMIHSYQIARF
jgi:DNA-binding CsgD family transcriptional regulator